MFIMVNGSRGWEVIKQPKATFRLQKNFKLINIITFVLFGKYCLIVDQLDLKDSSRDFQLNYVISYFFIYIYYFMYGSKDWCDRESKKTLTFRVYLNKAPRISKLKQKCSSFMVGGGRVLLDTDENGTDIFRPYSRPNPFRGVLIRPYSSPDI
jgi:hypothetical protein